jgi:hypothetical protein
MSSRRRPRAPRCVLSHTRLPRGPFFVGS